MDYAFDCSTHEMALILKLGYNKVYKLIILSDLGPNLEKCQGDLYIPFDLIELWVLDA